MGTVVGAAIVRQDGSITTVLGDIPVTGNATDGLIEYRYAYASRLVPAEPPRERIDMWRYIDLLPLSPGPIRYPLAVGGTPLVAPPRLRTLIGLPNLWLKDETRSPTGSNKDRATALVLEQALRSNARTITAASTGNVAVSLAVGAAASGLQAVIFVPASVAEGKLRLILLAGATVFRVNEGYEAAYKLSRKAAKSFGWLDRNTGANPFTVEAKKTAAFEIWEQMDHTVPDVVVVPVGDGTSLTAVLKGFRELVSCRVADRIPRVIGVQAKECQPLRHQWLGHKHAHHMPEGTIADGIAVDAPINGVTALRDVRESGGGFVAVSDDDLLEGIRTLACNAGLLVEPAAAAGYAGLAPALSEGLIDRDDSIVVYTTGTGLKTPKYLVPAGSAIQIDADLGEVAAAMQL